MLGLSSVISSALVWLCFALVANAIHISIPSTPSSRHVVQPNFLGISFEMGFLNVYFGNDTSTISPAFVNYLKALRSRTGNSPLRIRIGGNSMDSSNYNQSMTSSLMRTDPGPANVDDQPVTYGPVLWDVLNAVSSDVGNATYLIGLSLLNPDSKNVPLVAGDAAKQLASNLDGFLLGNEPDLYTAHKKRPNIHNYTTAIYMDEFQDVLNHLSSTSGGNITDKHDIGGPTICCEWNLDALLDDGYVKTFGSELEYISLQHYPQNICFGGKFKYGIPYYIQHANVVTLAEWQGLGVVKALANNRQKVIMSEFNSASCGGVPTVSDSFAVGSLWTTDYALQLASVGYSAAHLHTRERGISYNIFTSPFNGIAGPWSTGSPYYALLATAEALRSENGSIVVDLNVGGSMNNASAKVSGYAIYDANSITIQQIVLFNYANTTSSTNSSSAITIPSTAFPASLRGTITVKYLVGASLGETTNIGWGGQTLANTGNGTLLPVNATWAPPNTQLDCTRGCTIHVPSPGMALVLAGSQPSAQIQPLPITNSTNTAPPQNGTTGTNTTNNAITGTQNLITYIQTVLCALIAAWIII